MLRGWDRTFYSLTSIIISPSRTGTGRIDPCNNHLYKISIRAVRVSIQGRELYKCQANEAFMIINTTCGALQSEGGEWHIPGLSLTPGLAIWDMIHYLETSYSHICLYLGYNNCFTDTNTSRKFVWFFCGYLEGREDSYGCKYLYSSSTSRLPRELAKHSTYIASHWTRSLISLISLSSHNIKQKEVSAGVIEKSPRNDQLAASQS